MKETIRVGMLRQWINEDVAKEDRLVTNDDLMFWLGRDNPSPSSGMPGQDDWKGEFSKVFTFGGYCVNGDKYIAIQVNKNKNNPMAPKILETFIESLLSSQARAMKERMKACVPEKDTRNYLDDYVFGFNNCREQTLSAIE